MLMMSCASSQTISIRSLLHITSPLWNAMGNSWGNCPSNINHQVEQSVFLSLFFLSTGFFPLLVSMVTATLKDTQQEISPKEKQRMKAGGEGGQRMVRKRQKGVWVFNIFLWGASLRLASVQPGSWYTGPRVQTQTCTLFVSLFFPSFSTLLSLVLSAGEVRFLYPETHM